jgi:hypothetical protein
LQGMCDFWRAGGALGCNHWDLSFG